MKSKVERAITFLLVSLVMLAPAAYAQRMVRTVKANVPFDFTVGTRVFPAGNYSLVRIDASLLELRDSAGNLLANMLTRSVQASTKPARPKLLFDSQNGRHILIQVWQENEPVGQEILQPKAVIRAVQKGSGHDQTAEVGNPR